ncbi:MAG: hypothetical protein WA948_08340 [Pontixanthobacter sp.]
MAKRSRYIETYIGFRERVTLNVDPSQAGPSATSLGALSFDGEPATVAAVGLATADRQALAIVAAALVLPTLRDRRVAA